MLPGSYDHIPMALLHNVTPVVRPQQYRYLNNNKIINCSHANRRVGRLPIAHDQNVVRIVKIESIRPVVSH